MEVGCGPGRMTAALAERFDRVLGLDVSPAMVARAREPCRSCPVEFRAIAGERLEGVADGTADAVVRYLVLQHLPSVGHALGYLREFKRVLAPAGEAFVQLPVLDDGAVPRAWRAAWTIALPSRAAAPTDPPRSAARA